MAGYHDPLKQGCVRAKADQINDRKLYEFKRAFDTPRHFCEKEWEMKQNEYDPAETVEIGKAEGIILGWKDFPDPDSTANPPSDRLWVEEAILSENWSGLRY